MQSESEEAAGTRYTLLTVLETLLRLLHPIMPFITEDIWQRVKTELGKNGESIMLEPYPIADETNTDQAAIDECQWLQNIITAIRTLRSERQISPRESIPLLLRQGSVQDKAYDSKHRILLVTLAKLKDITWLNTNDTPPPAASTVVGELEIFIPMDQASQQDERERLQKEIAKIEIDIALIKGKLQNPQFIDRAPLAVVEKEKTRYTELSTTLAKLKALNFNK
ncbi:MAG: hypothetical protein ACD_45C00490G0001 [uncultured bacterium]|nr:MAG: hypothetical protein ACD_45C00490G0001 [uncultured bacterium]